MSDETRNKKGQFLDGHSEAGPGRDSLYDEAMNDQARKLALLGLTDAEMGEFFGVAERTIQNWYNNHPAFFHAVQEGKVVADANVADSLYKRATGEHVQTERLYVNKNTGEREAVKVMTFIPGEAGAALNWLKNRRQQSWRDKQEVAVSGEITQKIERVIVDAANTDS